MRSLDPVDDRDRLLSGAAWADFCERLRATGERLLTDRFPADPTGRAEGHRHVTRLLVMALQSHLEFADPDFPAFHRYDDHAVKWGGPNVDNHYLRARIDPAGTYRIFGDVAGVRELIVSTHEGDLQLGQDAVYAERRLADLVVGADGRLELFAGGEPRPGNWLPLDSRARLVMLRVYVSDWEHDAIGWYGIERLDRAADLPEPLDPAAVARSLDAASEWVDRSVTYWRDYLLDGPVRRFVNRLTPPRAAPGGSSQILYGAGWWELGADEGLLIEVEPPTAEYWSIQLYSSPWFESLDVANRLSSYTGQSAAVDADGVARFVVSAADPGLPNWLDTEGRTEGLVSYRWVWSQDAPQPRTRAGRIAEVVASCPAARRVGPGERRAQLAARRAGIARRFGR